MFSFCLFSLFLPSLFHSFLQVVLTSTSLLPLLSAFSFYYNSSLLPHLSLPPISLLSFTDCSCQSFCIPAASEGEGRREQSVMGRRALMLASDWCREHPAKWTQINCTLLWSSAVQESSGSQNTVPVLTLLTRSLICH